MRFIGYSDEDNEEYYIGTNCSDFFRTTQIMNNVIRVNWCLAILSAGKYLFAPTPVSYA
jgi:hypothetical protein